MAVTRRKNLKPEDRREQLLDCAQSLFFARGYDATTINDIMTLAGVSKGGFYHHFASKDQVLEALSRRMAGQAVERIGDVLDHPGLSPLDRLNLAFERMRQFKAGDGPKIVKAFEAAFTTENLILYDRLNRATSAVVAPLLTTIIEKGMDEGAFNVPDAAIAADIILRLGALSREAVAVAITARGTADAQSANEQLERTMRMQAIVVDRILGLPDDSVRLVAPGFVDALLKA
ncbi:TetR/AcrR family transcriptional regulator [Rhizobium sp. PL01]|uniref:TetR/AcrR family transcriptional regulator n=1 Tax=Rhizobium sp. PL01 TaxID=3085631 RepID=UPI0029820A36|nr:TetR/AcrR family transcriptional regulator [Rhizobium sp. PL01]MDW5318182.1 TetR/AcrR family transcriptional regulator [Rhizobium sp. PL01]